MDKPKYFAVETANRKADVYIFGDITSWPWFESDVSSYTLARTIQAMEDVDEITVHINSYGGEVAEGLAIHNSLKDHSAKITTICDGFACSAASVVFMAGDKRIMNPASLLMIHNAWSHASGNAKELRKAADDLDVISATAAEAYKAKVNIAEDELQQLLDNESWISPAEAVEMGFATNIADEQTTAAVNQSARKAVFTALRGMAEGKPVPKEKPPQDPPQPQNSIIQLFR